MITGSAERKTRKKSRQENLHGEPAWDVALLFPRQGQWDVEEYLSLDTNRQVEFTDGRVEVLPVPTTSHQLILFYLCRMLDDFATARRLGTTLPATLLIQLRPGKIRAPDIVFMDAKHADRIGERFWLGADLVMEIVSKDPKDRDRDLRDKRREYAKAGISEYWIVDPKTKQITVLRLKGNKYLVHGVFGSGKEATSHLLPGFSVDVDVVFSRRVE
jgi:Uma2 family endonuclease